MRSKLSGLTSIVLALFIFQTSWANNNLFLPGDAFFPTQLTKADLEGLQKAEGHLKFEYSNLGGYGSAFCGYAGHSSAMLPVVDDSFAKNIAKAYARVREFEGRELIEVETEDGETGACRDQWPSGAFL